MNVLYVSYDGLTDPLGSSQIEPYVRELSRRGHRFTVLTFEKTGGAGSRIALAESLAAEGIRWVPLAYHRRPRVPATVLDLWNGRRAIRQELRRRSADIIHCRGDVAMAMARAAVSGGALLYDMRGFYADERCEVGSWRRGGFVDRCVRRAERGNLSSADGLVVLTQSAHRVLLDRREVLPPMRVIPTSVDVERFAPGTREPDHGLAYVGSLGTWYLTEAMVALARSSVAQGWARPLFVSNQPEEAQAAGATPDWADVLTAAPAEVPACLNRCEAAFFLIRPSPAKRASCPTKLGEALACGLPVLANAGVGDVADTLRNDGVGVVLEEFSASAVSSGLTRLKALASDPACRRRCRRVAEERFGLATAVDAYNALYSEAAAHHRSRPSK